MKAEFEGESAQEMAHSGVVALLERSESRIDLLGAHSELFSRPVRRACAPSFSGRVPIGGWPRCQNPSRKRICVLSLRERYLYVHVVGIKCAGYVKSK
ncbi:hypothetical protein JTE90_021552 [Oedothorax gibbosus]|uniref:Uncharacterized protein n=1 Tax=Oedothorax gibbosus TaxID=931172 RepID=A0AAV6VQ08_9ARAC|nr:hypothetical protein JTE90_021552 [Oedothorax gibbosus]